MSRTLEDEIRRASRSIRAKPGGVQTRQKSYSLVPVQNAQNFPLRPMPRPSEQAIMRAANESPWLHIKIARLASAFSSLAFKVVQVKNDGTEKDMPFAHPLWVLLRKPNPILSGWHLRFLTEFYARTVGGCYWRLRGDGFGIGSQIWLYPPNWVQPIFGRDRSIAAYQVLATMPGGQTIEEVPVKQMFWFQIPDPLEPYSRSVGDALSLATEVDTFELASESDRRFFENDASPPGALVVPGRMEQDEVDRMKDDWNRKQGGPANQGNVAVLFGGMDYKTFRQGRKEMDFVDGQRYLRDVLIAGVHKHVLGISDDVNFAAAKAADYQVGKWELLPRVQWWQDNVDKIAHTFDLRLGVRWQNPVPQDEAIELEKANEGLARGAITRNEWRKANKFEEIDAEIGDVFLIQPGYVEVPADGGEPRTFVDPAAKPDGQSPRDGGDGGAPDKGTRIKNDEPNMHVDKGPIKPAIVSAPAGPVKAEDVVPAIEIKVGKLDPMHPSFSTVLEQIQAAVKTDDTMKVLEPVYESVMQSRLEDVKEELGLDPGLNVDDPTLLHYLRNVAGERVRRVDETTRGRIREELQAGTAAGEKLSQLEERIGRVFVEAKGPRAETIARTETIDASNATAYAAYERSGVVREVEWLLAPDYDAGEDRHVCDELEAAGPVELGQEFADGIAWPPAHPNCRCAVAPLVEGEEADPIDRRVEATEAETHDDPADKANQAFAEEFEVFGFEGGVSSLGSEEFRRTQNRYAAEVAFEQQQRVGTDSRSTKIIEHVEDAAASWTGGSAGELNVFYRVLHEPDSLTYPVQVYPDLSKDELIRAAQTWQDMSQEKLRELTGNAESIRVYRGFSNYAPGQKEDSMAKVLAREFASHEQVILDPEEGRTRLSSWTVSRDVAESFANQRGYGGVIVQAEVKISDTFGHALVSQQWIKGAFLEEQEIIVSGPVTSRLAQVVEGTKAGEGSMVTVRFNEDEMNWHRRNLRAAKGRGHGRYGGRRRRRRRWAGEARHKQVTALGKEHARLERVMRGKVQRAFQQQQTAVLRELRKAARE